MAEVQHMNRAYNCVHGNPIFVQIKGKVCMQ